MSAADRRARAGAGTIAFALAVAAPLAPGPARAAAQGGGPAIVAPAAVAVEASTGEAVFSRAAAEPRPIASATKLMTALLTVERAALSDVFTVAPYAANPLESLAGFVGGERASVRDLLEGLLLGSGNDAAVTLAAGVSGDQAAFVRDMNARARALGLRDTRFTDPVGLGAGNVSSARDLVRLARVARGHAFLRRTMDRTRARITTGGPRRVVANRNLLVHEVPFVNGVKTGRTEQAGYVLVGSATRDGVTVLSAVLGEPTEQARMADTLRLLRLGLRRFERATLVRRGARVARAGLAHRDGDEVALVAGADVRRVVRRGARPALRVVSVPEELEGPLPAGARVGEAEVALGGRPVARVPLVTAAAVAEASLGERLGSGLTRPATLVLVAVVLIASLLAVRLRRRVLRRVPQTR